jgi:hypothetical protein
VLQQSQVIRVFSLQGAYQDFEVRETTQAGQARIFQEQGPAREAGADASLKPFESGFALAD